MISSLKDYLVGGVFLSEKKMRKDTEWSIQAMHIKTPASTRKIRSPVRRQPAESHYRPLAAGQAGDPAAGRTDPRH